MWLLIECFFIFYIIATFATIYLYGMVFLDLVGNVVDFICLPFCLAGEESFLVFSDCLVSSVWYSSSFRGTNIFWLAFYFLFPLSTVFFLVVFISLLFFPPVFWESVLYHCFWASTALVLFFSVSDIEELYGLLRWYLSSSHKPRTSCLFGIINAYTYYKGRLQFPWCTCARSTWLWNVVVVFTLGLCLWAYNVLLFISVLYLTSYFMLPLYGYR